MAFRQSRGTGTLHDTLAQVSRGCCRSVVVLLRLIMAASVVAGLALFVLYLRLIEGPLELPGLNRVVADQVNAGSHEAIVSIGSIHLAIGEGREQSGLQFYNIEVRAPDDGAHLLDIPRVAARFQLADLLHGRFQPHRVTLIQPQGHFIRTKNGRVRFGVGQGSVPLVGGDAAPSQGTGGMDVVSAILDGFVGDADPAPNLEKLRRIRIANARLTYEDQISGNLWTSDDADLVVWRDTGGASARLTLNTETADAPGPALRLLADRRQGTAITTVRASFGRLDTETLASQLPTLEWLALLKGIVAGQADLAMDAQGIVTALDAELVIEDGSLSGMGPELAFDSAAFSLSVDPAAERLRLNKAVLSAPALSAEMAGSLDVRRTPDGEFTGMAGQLDLRNVHLDTGGLFSRPLQFETGQVTARWRAGDDIIEIAGGRLRDGDFAVQLEGRAMARPEGWLMDLRAVAQNATVQDLIGFWPVNAAANARGWVAKSIFEAQIDDMMAQIRVGRGEPHLAVDFTFRDLSSYYLKQMPPIRRASGRGHMSYHDLYLEVDAGFVDIPGRQSISISDSRVAIRDLWGAVTPIDIDLAANGQTAAILSLINEPPLLLVDKLGLDPASVAGSAQVDATLTFPLISELNIADIDVDVRSQLFDVRMPFAIGRNRIAKVAAKQIALRADTRGMTLSGPVLLDGAPLNINWVENYGARPGNRRISAKGNITPGLLAQFGADDLPVTGTAPFSLELAQTGSGPFAFELDADLAPARLDVAALQWSKARGQAGRLRASGKMDDGLDVSDFTLETSTLRAEGAVRILGNGTLGEADLRRVRLGRTADVSARIRPGQGDGLDVRLGGRFIDISDLETGGGETDRPDPVTVTLELERLVLSEALALTPASGRIERGETGDMAGRIEGRLAGAAPVTIEISNPQGRPGKLVLMTPDAGVALRAADLYSDARGGDLRLEATLGEGDAPLVGVVTIDDIVVRSQDTFRNVLREGGLDDAETEIVSSGIGFSRVRVPFSYANGVITLTDAVALSTALGLKVNGTVNEETQVLDLIGVMSPAYGLTGALDDIPVIGSILSGGKGEGILAMTFSVSGALKDPDVAVNPLSLLAPGFLRNIFKGDSTEVSEDFKRRIRRQDN